jgi:hypothetical protein
MVFRVQLVLVFFDAVSRLVKDYGFPETAVQELRSLPPASIELLSSSQVTALSLRVLSATEASAEGYKWRRPAIEQRGEHVVVLEGAVEHDLDALTADVAHQHENISRDELTSLAETLVASDVAKLAGDLSLAASIAVPGALEPTEIQCMVDGHSLWQREMSPTNIAPARAEATQKGWPPIRNLPLIPVLQWLRDIPGFRDGVPTGSLGRAVAALSRLLGYEENASGSALMWSMVGLETLYTSGREGLSEQLREKAQVLLGRVETHKKAFNGLYSFRSKFIHGALDSPLAYTPYDGVDAFWKTEGAVHDAELLALSLLVASLQVMAARKITELLFRWVLDEALT